MISRSEKRHNFQLERYLERCKEKGEEPNQDYVDMYKTIFSDHEKRFDAAGSKDNNLEYDLLTTDWILEKTRNSESYAQNLYAALCNNQFIKNEVITILKEEAWSCTWRYAGGIIADIKGYGDYLDYYCTGIGNGNYDSKADELAYRTKQYVPEGEVTDEIKNDLFKLGWIIKET